MAWPRDNYVKDEIFPTIDDDCGGGTCTPAEDMTCHCQVTVTNSQAFSDSDQPADADAILSRLKIGAFPPEQVGGYSTGIALPGDSSVTVYHLLNQGYTEDTIFKVRDVTDEFVDFGDAYREGSSPPEPVVGVVYLKNMESNIQFGDVANDYYSQPGRKLLIMRNPMMFHDLVKPEIRDAHYEVDAVIHHLTSHQNAAPFVSKQLIQLVGGISNPR